MSFAFRSGGILTKNANMIPYSPADFKPGAKNWKDCTNTALAPFGIIFAMKSKRYMMLSLVAVAISALPAFAAVLLFSMTGCAALRPDRPDGFVSLAEAVPDAILEPRYYSTYNFIGDRIDGYEEPCAILSK